MRHGIVTHRIVLVALVAVAVSVTAALATADEARAGAVFIVDAGSDTVDASPGDGVCADANGDCSLRAAVMEANALAGADEIQVGRGRFLLSIAGAGEDAALTGDLDVTDDLLLVGTGTRRTVLDAAGLDRAVDVKPGVTVHVVDLTVTGGAVSVGSESGGAISNSGDLTLASVEVRNNWALTAGGGLLSSGAGSTVTIEGGSFIGNTAANGNGGAIFVGFGGSADINAVEMSGNTAGFRGGAVAAVAGDALAIMQSTLLENSAADDGGALYLVNEGEVFISDSRISGNDSGTRGGAASIFDGLIHLDRVAVVGNSALTDAGPPTQGGGLWIAFSATVEVDASDVRYNRADSGGGIANLATAHVTGTNINENVASITGGGVFNQGFGATLVMTGSTVSRNESTVGGGAGINNNAELTIVNSTISGNTATGAGGGLFDFDGVVVAMTTLTQVTFSGNTASSGGGIYVGNTASIEAAGTIVANNVATVAGGDCSAAVTSLGYNLDGDGSCGLASVGDISGSDPKMQVLKSNGGPTETHMLLPGSPALDAIPAAACAVTTDQRGEARPQGSDCDIGAVERGSPPVVRGGGPPG